jgi:hypothetical protein
VIYDFIEKRQTSKSRQSLVAKDAARENARLWDRLYLAIGFIGRVIVNCLREHIRSRLAAKTERIVLATIVGAVVLGYWAVSIAPSSRGAAPAPAVARAAAPETPAQFGLVREVAPVVDLPAIESTIPGHFDGWYPNRRIRLANGQVWQVADGSSRVYDLDNPKVTIRRGVLGAFYLDL